jgi:hypothetical protein
MPELDVAPVTFKVKAVQAGRVGVTASSGAQVILVPVPGGEGPTGPAGDGAQVFGETLTGADGATTVFTTAHPYRPNSTAIYLNGLREFHTEAYTETSSTTVTFSDPPLSGDSIRVDYIIQ